MSAKILELKAERGAIIDSMSALAASREFDPAKHAELKASAEKLDTQIRALEEAESLQASLARHSGANAGAAAGDAPEMTAVTRTLRAGEVRSFGDCLRAARSEMGFSMQPTQHYRSLGEQLQAVFQHHISRGANTDSRLVRAPTGAGEVDPTGGGFLVQTDFAAAIFMLAHDMGEIMGRTNKIPISANANGLKVPGVDETSRATGSRWGGVSSSWAAEGISPGQSAPKFRLVEFDLKKLMSLMTVTDELLQDSTALTSIAGQAFSEEVMFMTEDAIFEGTGAGQPLGILNAPCTVQVAKENGQAAGTIVKENIDKMWARCWARSRKNAVWFINQDCESQLSALNGVVGTGGQLVYMPPGGLSAAPFATLMGRPVVATEYNSALGAPGDIGLFDLSQYTLVDKGGVNFASSMHVAFDTDQMRFRITYRVDGKPMWAAPLTPFKGTLTKSPFITLAQR